MLLSRAWPLHRFISRKDLTLAMFDFGVILTSHFYLPPIKSVSRFRTISLKPLAGLLSYNIAYTHPSGGCRCALGVMTFDPVYFKNNKCEVNPKIYLCENWRQCNNENTVRNILFSKYIFQLLKLHNCFVYFLQTINPWRMVFYFFILLPRFWGTCPLNLSLADLPLTCFVCCDSRSNLKWWKLKLLPRGSLSEIFYLPPPKIGCPGQLGNH